LKLHTLGDSSSGNKIMHLVMKLGRQGKKNCEGAPCGAFRE
jgi:hypothetical protein